MRDPPGDPENPKDSNANVAIRVSTNHVYRACEHIILASQVNLLASQLTPSRFASGGWWPCREACALALFPPLCTEKPRILILEQIRGLELVVVIDGYI